MRADGWYNTYVRIIAGITKTGQCHQVRAFSRKIAMPKRQFLGFSPDILKIAQREVDYGIKKDF